MPKNTSSIQRDRAWLIDRSAASAWITSSFLGGAHLRRILRCYVRYYNDAERIGHWRKIRLSLVRFSGPDPSNRIPSSADSITTMPEFEFSVHTGYSEGKSARYRLARISTSRSTYRHSAVLRSRRTISSKASACSGAYSNQVRKSNGSPSSRL